MADYLCLCSSRMIDVRERVSSSSEMNDDCADSQSLVFMVVNSNLKGGMHEISSFVQTQAKSLRDVGCHTVIGIVDNRTSIRGIFRNIRRLKGEIAQIKPGLVHAQYGSVTAAVADLVKGSLPLVVSFCGDDLLGTPVPGLTWRVRERGARLAGLWAAKRATAIIVKSDNLFHALPASLRKRVTILPNGVDISWFKPMDRDKCRSKLGWGTQSKIVLFNASCNEDQYRKNPYLARATVDLVGQSVPDVSLRVMSNANSEEVRLMLNAADCLLVTSLHEGSPNIVKEAMACNLPVVSVPCGDVDERLKPTTPGEICPYDPHTLAQAVQKVLLTGSRSNGRDQIIEQGLTAENVAARLVQLYSRVLQNGTSDNLNPS
jgi:teichuronic acid biosynthesis glycosyltransferase TuaC